MIPLRDVIPSRSTPYVTVTAVTLASLVWLFELTHSRVALLGVLHTFGVVPDTFRSGTLFSAPWLHASWIHAIGNVWCLWIFGENVEARLGHLGFAVFVVLSGAVAPMALVMFDPTLALPIVGASGAVAAVAGAYAVLYPGSRVLTLAALPFSWDLVELPALGIIGAWFLLQLGGGLGAVGPTVHTQDPALALATYIATFVVGAVVAVATGKRRAPAGEW